MKYLIQLAEADHFRKWDEADDALRQRVYEDFGAFDAAVKARGSIVAGEALAPSSTARTVQPGEPGARGVTDGPYAETVEQMGGFYVIDVPDLDAAIACAGLLPREYLVEVRECVDVDLS